MIGPTTQQIFNTMVTHLREQGTKCVTEDGCRYRDGQGRKCAVGALITDEVYASYNYDDFDTPHNGLEDCNIEDTGVQRAVEKSFGLNQEDGTAWQDFDNPRGINQLMYEMQLVHDTNDIGEWETHFANIADKYGLVMP